MIRSTKVCIKHTSYLKYIEISDILVIFVRSSDDVIQLAKVEVVMLKSMQKANLGLNQVNAIISNVGRARKSRTNGGRRGERERGGGSHSHGLTHAHTH